MNDRLLKKARGHYQRFAVLGLSTLILFSLLNLFFLVVILVREAQQESNTPAYWNYEEIGHLYPNMTEQQVSTLLAETWNRHLVFAPFTQFSEGPFAGTYVNVDPAGFRRTQNQGVWPPDASAFNVFLFGGSTAFGYGLPDNQTLSSRLQASLNTCFPDAKVYNFGQGFYYSTQERALFEKLLLQGYAPDLAVFVDGLNEFQRISDEPEFSDVLAGFMELNYSRSAQLANALVLWPLCRSLVREKIC